MNLADLSKEDWAQIAIAVKERSSHKGQYTKLVESIDKRLKNIERMVAKIASDQQSVKAVRLTADDLHELKDRAPNR